jgi:hypothetical protein
VAREAIVLDLELALQPRLGLDGAVGERSPCEGRERAGSGGIGGGGGADGDKGEDL